MNPPRRLRKPKVSWTSQAGFYKPARLLRWHYRSQHGSLIAFSNKEFYRGELIVFPSPLTASPELGVKFVYIADGVYENRRNMVEAERVIDAVFEHMRIRPGESLGVVTLNSAQREVIENEIEQRLKDDIYAQRYIDATGPEPFFIKNLENVQGDERDVIFISVTYGPAPNPTTRHVYQRFGPINSATGHRRLNVLFTRAKRRVVVFSSMLADDIHVLPNSQWGVRALKGYLAYAQTGILDQAQFTGREPDSDFEIEVADALRARGFDVVAQLGVAGYFIDIAVKHPRRADAYVLAIECDGAMYHSSLSARDRDRLRQSVLESLGWKVHRIWSTDWFKNSRREVGRIKARIKQILHQEEEDELQCMGRQDATTTRCTGQEMHATTSVTTANLSEQQGAHSPNSGPTLRLTLDEARTQLIELRERGIKPAYPDADPTRGLLRKNLLDAVLRYRPTTRVEWDARIPKTLRVVTDERQLEYLDRIFEIVARIRE